MTNPARRPTAAAAGVTRDIVAEDFFPHPPERIWKALTTAEIIGRWLMPNDFEAVIGKHFTFTTRPMGNWDGVVRCEVLDVVPHRRLVYSWRGGSDADNPARLDSTVAWTLQPEGSGTRLRMVHSGFRSPHNDSAYEAMSPGWRRLIGRLGEIAATL
jgi:uncharacterized protein YndB with AHSA1/START domain